MSSLNLLVPGIHLISGIARVMHLYSELHSAAAEDRPFIILGRWGRGGTGHRAGFPPEGPWQRDGLVL